MLPTGWALTNLVADGGPEVVNGNLVWTKTNLPPSPIQVVYVIQVPTSDQGPKQQMRSLVEYQALGMLNPADQYAAPDFATITATNVSQVQFATVHRLPNGGLQFQFPGNVTNSVRLQAATSLALKDWITLTNLPSLEGTLDYINNAISQNRQRFYRIISP